MIRYLDYSDPYANDYYLCESETHWCFIRKGHFGNVRDFVFPDTHKEIPAPDPDLIEERYINATDRPNVDGFKYGDDYSWDSKKYGTGPLLGDY